MKYSKIIAIIAATLITSISAMAYEFAPLGHESIGMGGAGVANADESLAGYYNPALLANGSGMEVSVGGGVSIQENNIGKNIDRLSSLGASSLANSFGASFNGTAKPTFTATQNANLIEVQSILNSFASNNGLAVGVEGNASASFGNIAFGAFATGNAGGRAVVSKTNTDYVFLNKNVTVGATTGDIYYKYNPSIPANNITYNVVSGGVSVDPYALGGRPAGLTYDPLLTQAVYNATSIQAGLNDKSKTYIRLTGVGVVEAPLSYATTVGLPLIGDINVGGSIKAMVGTTYDQNISIDTDSGQIKDDLKNAKKTSTQLGVDLGVLYHAMGMNIGVVGKNLNSPKFKTIFGNEIAIKPSYRAGVSTELFKGVKFAADYDINKAQLLDGTDVQWLGGGIKAKLFWDFLQISAGAMSNVANPSSLGAVYTGGLQTDFWICKLNVSGQMSQKKGQYDGKEVPKYMKVNGSLIFNW
ncbi:MAG: conjugal transfer protein TraF [bacterium]